MTYSEAAMEHYYKEAEPLYRVPIIPELDNHQAARLADLLYESELSLYDALFHLGIHPVDVNTYRAGRALESAGLFPCRHCRHWLPAPFVDPETEGDWLCCFCEDELFADDDELCDAIDSEDDFEEWW